MRNEEDMMDTNFDIKCTFPTILVTGGAGFVGSNFLRYMLPRYQSYHFINLDKLTYSGNSNNLLDIDQYKNHYFIQGDIGDPNLLDSIIRDYSVDIIVNFAAESHVDRSIKDPGIFIQTNVNGTQVLLGSAVKHGIKLFLQISTDEVYGSLQDEGVFTELSPLAPNNPYSASKASADLLIRSYSNTYGLPFNIVRFGNTYGPSQHPEKLIPMTILNALNDQPIPIHGQGMSIRDWVFVKDNNAAINTVLHSGKRGEIYNIGSGEEKRTIDVVHYILEILNKPKELIRFIEDRPGQDYRYANYPAKIMNELRWKPEYQFEEGLHLTIEWNMKNKDWWKHTNKVLG
jgi:dTDP-glucose 4,6-dehydratase